MSESGAGGGAAKGRLVGFVSLGALLALVGVALYSSRETSTRPPTASPSPAAPSRADVAASSSAGVDPNGGPVVSDITKMPRLADSLKKRPPKGGIVTAQIEDIALSPQARLLAERLKCVCGCPDTLAVCVCKKTPGSRDMKRYLQELVSAGKTPSEVESAMVARYGEKVLD